MSLAKTYLQNIRVQYPSNNDRDELRRTQAGLLNAVIDSTNSMDSVVSPDLIEKANESVGRELEIPVTKKGNITIKNVRSCTIEGDQTESDLVRVTFKTIVADVFMVKSQYRKNHVKYLFDLNKKLREIAEAFNIEIENDIDTALDANKSLVYGSSIVGNKYPIVGGAIQVEPDQLNRFFGDIRPINYADDFNNFNVKIVGSHEIMPTVEFYVNQGGGNESNTSYQFNGLDFGFSNRISNGANATGYFMPEGSIGLLDRRDIDAVDGNEAGDGTMWFEDNIPEFRLPVGVMFKSECSDQSALEAEGLGHLTATMVERWQISLDYAIVVPYNSDLATKPSSIRKFEFVPATASV